MYVLIDETADFVESGKHKFGIVTLVTCTDKSWDKFAEKMNSVLPNWKSTKSKDILNNKRKKIIKEITLRGEIKYHAYVFDIQSGSDDFVIKHKEKQTKKIIETIEYCIKSGSPKTLIADLKLFKNQIFNYSSSDYAKFILIFDLLAEWNKYHLYDYLKMPDNRDDWNFHIIIDTQNKSKKFERLIKLMLFLVTNARNKEYKAYIPVEWSKNHPYIKKYSIKTIKKSKNILIDAKKIYSNIEVLTEQNSPQLFMPDFIGSIIHKSIFNQQKNEYHKMLKKLSIARSISLNNKDNKLKNNYYHIKTFNPNIDSASNLLKKHKDLIS